ncbi:MAG: Rrf2 family transcriptional regulator, partial [Methylobacteriaceae bacterium]|nr:Rrf2 family transcriptional regulator [Methylobacteriaceae bacterium]
RVPVGESLQTKDIAEREGIPRAFLEHIMLDLKRDRLVGSRRGKNGGYFLLKPPSEIIFGEILRLIDGPLAPLPCLSRHAYKRCEDCADETTCAVRCAFADVFQAMLGVLDGLSLADAIERSDRARAGLPGYGANPYSGAFI